MNSQTTPDLPSRLITLPDGRSGLRGTLQVETREPSLSFPGGEGRGEEAPRINSSNSCLDFISSDETLDRYGEIISAAGWRLENYRRNPVFQNAHQYGDVIFTLGRALITEVREVGTSRRSVLFQRIQFATDVNPMARIAYGLYKGKFLNAVSVGFVPLRWVNGDPVAAGVLGQTGSVPAVEGGILPPGPVSDIQASSEVCNVGPPRETRGSTAGTEPVWPKTPAATPKNFRRKYLEQELLEVSAVGIPANPNALALGLKSGAVEKSDLKELHDLIRQTLGTSKDEWQPVPVKVKRPDEMAELLRLAKEVREILRA